MQNATHKKQNPLVIGLDITGTFIFAIEGALAAIQAHLDLLGVLVLAFATALGGGIIRDVLIGAVTARTPCATGATQRLRSPAAR